MLQLGNLFIDTRELFIRAGDLFIRMREPFIGARDQLYLLLDSPGLTSCGSVCLVSAEDSMGASSQFCRQLNGRSSDCRHSLPPF